MKESGRIGVVVVAVVYFGRGETDRRTWTSMETHASAIGYESGGPSASTKVEVRGMEVKVTQSRLTINSPSPSFRLFLGLSSIRWTLNIKESQGSKTHGLQRQMQHNVYEL